MRLLFDIKELRVNLVSFRSLIYRMLVLQRFSYRCKTGLPHRFRVGLWDLSCFVLLSWKYRHHWIWSFACTGDVKLCFRLCLWRYYCHQKIQIGIESRKHLCPISQFFPLLLAILLRIWTKVSWEAAHQKVLNLKMTL